MRSLALLGFSLPVCFCGAAAFAQDGERSAAATHVDRGAALFAQGAFRAALGEFEAAHRLSGSWQVLIHVGITQGRLSRYRAAHATLTRYLREGGAAVPPATRAQVGAELARLRDLLCELAVVVLGGPATITVDGEALGTSPLDRPLLLDPGAHRVRAARAGHEPAEARVALVSGERKRITLTPMLPLGILRVDSRPQGARVSLNGKPAGRTPFEERLPGGEYRIDVALAGHHPGHARVLLPGNQTRERSIELVAKPLPKKRWYTRWYWWTAIGAGVATAVVLGVVLTRPSYDEVIRSDGWPAERGL